MNRCDLPDPQHLRNDLVDLQFANRVLPKQLVDGEATVVGVIPDFFRQRLQLRLCIARPFKRWSQPLQQCIRVRRCFSYVVKLIAITHGRDEHLVGRLSDFDRLQALGNRLDPGSEGKTSRNIVAEEKLPEGFLSGELLELTTAKCAALKEERGHPLVVIIQHFELARLSGADDGLMDGDQIEVRQATTQLLRTRRRFARPHVVEPKRHLFAQKEKERGDALRDGDEILSIETL